MELKPCPFCGGKAKWISDGDNHTVDISCERRFCFAFRWKDEARYYDEGHAIKGWNRRVGEEEKE